MTRILCVGEAMLELSPAPGDGAWRLGFGGDTLNSAIHMARDGGDVGYFTAIGDEALSSGLTSAWQAEGLDVGLILVHPERSTGLYAITTDAAGERSFSYWRDKSAARAMMELPGTDAAVEQAASADLLLFSLISLAILPPAGRQRLLDLAAEVRSNGGRVAFDGNYRPRLWGSHVEASFWRDRAIASADIGLPTAKDESMLGRATPEAVADHWQGLGCGETIVKLSAQGCRLPDGSLLPPADRLHPVDTSGAGDAFNAGYLLARTRGFSPAEAARYGHAKAGGSARAGDNLAFGIADGGFAAEATRAVAFIGEPHQHRNLGLCVTDSSAVGIDAGATKILKVNVRWIHSDEADTAIDASIKKEIAGERQHVLCGTARPRLAVVDADDKQIAASTHLIGDINAEAGKSAAMFGQQGAVEPDLRNIADTVEFNIVALSSAGGRIKAQTVPADTLAVVRMA